MEILHNDNTAHISVLWDYNLTTTVQSNFLIFLPQRITFGVLGNFRNKIVMTKIILLLILIPFISTGQLSPNNQKYYKDSPIRKTITDGKTDTINLNIKDTTKLIFSATNYPETRLVFIRENGSNSPDYFKYIFPIITLLLGIGINKLLDYFSDKKKIKKTGQRWIAEIRGLYAPMKKQVELLEELLLKDQEDVYLYPELQVIPTLDCEIFKTLDKNEFLQYIQSVKKIKYKEAIVFSNQTHGFVSVLVYLHQAIKTKFDEYLKGTSNHISSLNRNLQMLSQEFAKYGVLLEKKLKSDPISDLNYKAMLDLFNNEIEPHRNDGAFDAFHLGDAFFIPLIQILAHLRMNDDALPLSTYTIECLNAIKGIKMEKHYWRENLTIIIKKYKQQLNDLDNVVTKIE